MLFRSIPASASIDAVPFDRWRELGADGVISGAVQRQATGIRVELRLYSVRARQSIYGREYTGSAANPRLYAHTMSDEVHESQRRLRGVARTKLAFISDRNREAVVSTVEKREVKEVYIADYDGANPRRITINRTMNLTPSWSPDGRSLVVAAAVEGYYGLHHLELATGRWQRLTTDEADERGPAWSQDGRWIYYASTRGAVLIEIAGGPPVRGARWQVWRNCHGPSLAPLPVCPRATLRRLIDELAGHGLHARAAFEVECMVFREDVVSARGLGYRNLTPWSLHAPIGYSIESTHRTARFMSEVCRRLDSLGVPWEGWHDEAAPGQIEINIEVDDALAACDHVVRVRQVVRETAFDLGHCATFMAKPSAEYGNGLHVHHSLRRADGTAAFHDEHTADHKTELFHHWLGGLMATLPGATSLMAPTINSYRRLVGWAAAPITPTWAEDNKSTAVRVLSRSAQATRIEHRVAAADANPYLVLAAILAGGLAGIDGALTPPPATEVADRKSTRLNSSH